MILNSFKHCSLKTIGLITGCVVGQILPAQTKIDFSNLNAFQKPGGSWHIAGDTGVRE